MRDSTRWPSRPSASSATRSSLQLQLHQHSVKSTRPANHSTAEAAIGKMQEMTSLRKRSTRLGASDLIVLASKDTHQKTPSMVAPGEPNIFTTRFGRPCHPDDSSLRHQMPINTMVR